MKLKSRHTVDPSFNMSSMTDVVFLLLIFFILTSSSAPLGKKVDLPSSNQQQISSEKLRVEITEELHYYVDGEKVPFENLKTAMQNGLKELSSNKLENTIVIGGDKDVNYGKIMEVVGIAAEINNVSVTLATKPKK